MKNIVSLFVCVVSAHFTSGQINQSTFNKVINSAAPKANEVMGGKASTNKSTPAQTDEIIEGLKEALSIGAKNSTLKLNNTDGYFANAAIKIIMPEEVKKVESALRKVGMSKLADDVILSMNRAAEDAAGGAKDIFMSAIRKMTISDGLAILRGDDFAATNFLRKQTGEQLTAQMKPVIDASLQKVNATAYWEKAFSAYNRFAKSKVETDLSSYVTSKALDGLFYTIGEEEQKIRKNPAARTTDLLKKVFGK